MAKKLRPIPLAPWAWIAKEIGYFKRINIPMPHGSIPQDLVASTDIGEFPETANKDTKAFMLQLAKKGADPNFILAVLYNFCNPNNRSTFQVVDKERTEQLKSLLQKIKTIPEELSGLIKPEVMSRFKSIIIDIEVGLSPLFAPDVVSSIIDFPKEQAKLERGRPSNPYMDRIVLLLFRHFRKRIKVKPGHKGAYQLTRDLLSLCFPKTYRILTKQAVENRIAKLYKDRECRKECLAFEKKFGEIGEKFHNEIKQSEYYEELYKEYTKITPR